MNKTRFVDCFWGSDFNSTAGFDTLCKRMRDGKQMCVEFEEFIKQRADAEERYGKSLMKLARTGETMMEIGTLRQSWDAVRQETENCGRAHLEFSQQLLENVEKVTREFKEEQKNKRKPVEDNIKKVQRNKKLCFDNHFKAKRSYEQRCREHDTCVDQLKKSASQQSRDEEKLRQRLAKAKTSVESADTSYQSTVKHLEDSRKEWEREMESCCKTFQELEKERIAFLRNSMWTYTNLGSTNCVKNDEFFEETRKSLEHCDIDSDIHLFISAKQTGSERPGQIFYENFYTVQNNQKSGLSTPQSTRGGHPLGKQQSLPPTPVQRNQNDFIDDEEEEDPTYASVNDFKKATNKARPSRIVIAEYDYSAQGREELTFNEGDLIKVLHEEDGTWWRGEINGRSGMFPREFVKIVK